MIKKIIAWLHLWLGLISGIVVFILGITGCILVFEEEIRSLAYPWVKAKNYEEKTQLPPSILYHSVAKAFPDKEIYSVWYHGEGKNVHFSINSDSIIYVNPYTAEIVASVDHEDFFHFIEEGHFHAWLPEKIGEAVVGWSTLIFVVLLFTGIVLWWPKRWSKNNIRKSFKIKWKAKFKRLNYDLHNVLGFYSLLIAFLIAFTGLIMSFPWFYKSVFWLAEGGNSIIKKRIEAVSDTTHNMQLVQLSQVDKAWKKGITEIGEHNKDQIIVSFPKKASNTISLCVDMYKGAWRYVYLDQHTLKELPASELKIKDEDFAGWLRRSNYGLHVGAFGGLTTKFLFFFASLICASLPITGFYIWWGRRRKAKKEKSKTSSQHSDKKRTRIPQYIANNKSI